MGALFDKFDGFFCSKSRACQLASLLSQTKPSRHKPRACQKSYGFINLVKFGIGETNFKITLGACVFKKSFSTSNLGGVGALFDKFYGFFVQNRGHAT